MANYSEIQKVLDDKLALIADLPLIVTENDLQTKTQTNSAGVLETKYIRTQLLPATTQALTIGTSGKERYTGLFQVTIFTPYDNGIAETNYWIDEIINDFSKTETIVITGGLVRITQRSRLPATQNTNYHQCGVDLEYECILNI